MSEKASPQRILLVDDNLTNLQVLFRALQEEGYDLLVAQSGEEALDIATAASPALVLLDINMPGIDGYETCRRLKADPATEDAAVIFLSARGAVQDKVMGLDLGAVDYIGKPFEFEEVIARVRKHLQIRQRHQELEGENRALREEAGAGFRELDAEALLELMAGGEHDRLEFKSTLRTNLHTGKADKRMENACLKTLAAYLNADGGILLVGVDDEGRPLGLKPDNFPNDDKLLLHMTGLIRNHLGGETVQFIRTSIHRIDHLQVLAVQCLRSAHPVFFRRDKEEMFFVRAGPSTQQLTPSEVVAYIRQREE